MSDNKDTEQTPLDQSAQEHEQIIDNDEVIIDEGEINFDDDDQDQDEAFSEELKKQEEKYLKLLAEYDNYRRRTAKESLEAKDRGKIEVFEKVIETVDTLELALSHVEEENEFSKGVTMVLEKLKREITTLGLEEVSYETFDANYHMAVATDENPELEDDQITAVLQKGYQFDGKLVRQAMVKVNKK